MIGRVQSKRLSRGFCVPMPWTQTIPVRRGSPGLRPGTAALRSTCFGGGGAGSAVGTWRVGSSMSVTVPRHSPGCVSARQPGGGYDASMYIDALSFLEDERDAWRPFEALSSLTDEQLERSVAAARGWSGRDLMGHLVHWQILALDVAKELAVNEHSPAKDAADADFEARGDVVVNAEVDELWRSKP